MSSDRKSASETTVRGGIFSRFRRRKGAPDAAEGMSGADVSSAAAGDAAAVEPERPVDQAEEQETAPRSGWVAN